MMRLILGALLLCSLVLRTAGEGEVSAQAFTPNEFRALYELMVQYKYGRAENCPLVIKYDAEPIEEGQDLVIRHRDMKIGNNGLENCTDVGAQRVTVPSSLTGGRLVEFSESINDNLDKRTVFEGLMRQLDGRKWYVSTQDSSRTCGPNDRKWFQRSETFYYFDESETIRLTVVAKVTGGEPKFLTLPLVGNIRYMIAVTSGTTCIYRVQTDVANVILGSARPSDSPSVSPIPSNSAVPSPSASASIPMPSSTPSASSAAVESTTPSASASPAESVSQTSSPNVSPSVSSTSSPSVTASITASAISSPSASSPASANGATSSSPSASVSSAPSSSVSSTPSASMSSAAQPTQSSTPSASMQSTQSASTSSTPSSTPPSTESSTPSAEGSTTPTQSSSARPSPTSSATPTSSLSPTPTRAPTQSPEPSLTIPQSLPPTKTPTPSATTSSIPAPAESSSSSPVPSSSSEPSSPASTPASSASSSPASSPSSSTQEPSSSTAAVSPSSASSASSTPSASPQTPLAVPTTVTSALPSPSASSTSTTPGSQNAFLGSATPSTTASSQIVPLGSATPSARISPTPFFNIDPGNLGSEDRNTSTIDGTSTCFPASALVTTQTRGSIRIADLQPGESVWTGTEFSRVLTFSHRDAATPSSFISLCTSAGCLLASPGHFVYLNGSLAPARAARLGDVTNMGRVVSVATVRELGLYNPHTESGDLAVNGFHVSCYTERVEVCTAHALLAPVRVLGRMVPRLAELVGVLVASVADFGGLGRVLWKRI